MRAGAGQPGAGAGAGAAEASPAAAMMAGGPVSDTGVKTGSGTGLSFTDVLSGGKNAGKPEDGAQAGAADLAVPAVEAGGGEAGAEAGNVPAVPLDMPGIGSASVLPLMAWAGSDGAGAGGAADGGVAPGQGVSGSESAGTAAGSGGQGGSAPVPSPFASMVPGGLEPVTAGAAAPVSPSGAQGAGDGAGPLAGSAERVSGQSSQSGASIPVTGHRWQTELQPELRASAFVSAQARGQMTGGPGSQGLANPSPLAAAGSGAGAANPALGSVLPGVLPADGVSDLLMAAPVSADLAAESPTEPPSAGVAGADEAGLDVALIKPGAGSAQGGSVPDDAGAPVAERGAGASLLTGLAAKPVTQIKATAKTTAQIPAQTPVQTPAVSSQDGAKMPSVGQPAPGASMSALEALRQEGATNGAAVDADSLADQVQDQIVRPDTKPLTGQVPVLPVAGRAAGLSLAPGGTAALPTPDMPPETAAGSPDVLGDAAVDPGEVDLTLRTVSSSSAGMAGHDANKPGAQSGPGTLAAQGVPVQTGIAALAAGGMLAVSSELFANPDYPNAIGLEFRSGGAGFDPVALSRSDAMTNPGQAQSGQLATQVAGEMARNLQNGQTRFQMRFDPPELGRVEVKMKVGADGTVQAHLIVERAETLDMFLRDQRGLEKALEAAGLNADSESLKFSLKDQGSQGFGSGDNDQGGSNRLADGGGPDGKEDADETGSVMQPVQFHSNGRPMGLDIQV
ncbi:flagellar hook-length control protein FliK [Roseibium aquae]|nr:flagellar hook-length control protein FliK [Roseibium aquae]